MEQNEETRGNAAFGAYLKKVREGRRLSLDAVEELSAGFPEKVTKSHLSRIENGLALPTFPRLMAMGHIYGVPIASLAERYEIELRRGMAPVDLGARKHDEVLREIDSLIFAGDFNEALLLMWALAEQHELPSATMRGEEPDPIALATRLRIVHSLIVLGRYEYARLLAERLLSLHVTSLDFRIRVMQMVALVNTRLKNFTIALLVTDECARLAQRSDAAVRFRADVASLRGQLLMMTAQHNEAAAAYREAIEGYRTAGNAFEESNARICAAAAMIEIGQLDDARGVLREVLNGLESGSHERLRAMALSNLALLEFRAGRIEDCESAALKSNAVARPRDYSAVVFRNCFYLWRIAQLRSDDAAMKLNERSLRKYLGRLEDQLPEVEEFKVASARAES